MTFCYSLSAIRELLPGSRLIGDTQHAIMGIASLEAAQPGDLSFLGNPRYKKQVAASKASLLLLPEESEIKPPAGQAHLIVTSPSLALAKICAAIQSDISPKPPAGVHPSAVVDPSAAIDPTASIGPLCVIGARAKIGKHCILGAHCVVEHDAQVGEFSHLFPSVQVLERCEIGAHVILQSGVVIGSEGYGYDFEDGRHTKLPQIGTVVLSDFVEIGANTTIDRGRFGPTRVGEGTKIDNLVQVAHNVSIGSHCLIVAQVGIAGSTHIGDFVFIGGQAGLAGHLKIGNRTRIGAQSGLNQDLPEDSFVRGTPVSNYMEAHRIDILKRRLPQLFKRVDTLERCLQNAWASEDAVSQGAAAASGGKGRVP